jgi:hypothetical protein
MQFFVDDIVKYSHGGFGVVKYADVDAVLVKFENGDYDVFDQNGDSTRNGNIEPAKG